MFTSNAPHGTQESGRSPGQLGTLGVGVLSQGWRTFRNAADGWLVVASGPDEGGNTGLATLGGKIAPSRPRPSLGWLGQCGDGASVTKNRMVPGQRLLTGNGLFLRSWGLEGDADRICLLGPGTVLRCLPASGPTSAPHHSTGASRALAEQDGPLLRVSNAPAALPRVGAAVMGSVRAAGPGEAEPGSSCLPSGKGNWGMLVMPLPFCPLPSR